MSAWEGSEFQRRQEVAAEERRRQQAAEARRREEQVRRDTEAANRQQEQMQDQDQQEGLLTVGLQFPEVNLTDEQKAERAEQLFLALLRQGAGGRVSLVRTLYNRADEEHKTVLQERKLNPQFERIVKWFERIERELDGTEDWSGPGACPSTESFRTFVRDLRAARDLILAHDRQHVRVTAMQEILKDLGVSAPHAPELEDRSRR